MLHAFICLCKSFQMKCSVASDVLTSLAPLLSVHVSAVLSCMTLLCPKMSSSCRNSLWKSKLLTCDVHLWQKHFRQNMFVVLKTINIICFQPLSPTPKLSATNSAWFMSSSFFKRLWNDSSEISESSPKCFGFKV